ncbi:MAG TPA: Arm DNA-binding domain-containing protein [Puia sp.]|jgi:hypothetical protein|nr:Arm DNA-binding domain-containing protein [Puia sp.]
MSVLSKRFSLLFYLKKQKEYVKGDQPIYLPITINCNRTEIFTKRFIDPDRWNSSAGRAKGTKEEIKALNAYLDLLQSKVYYAQHELIQGGIDVTGAQIKNKLIGIEEKPHMLIEVIKEHNKTIERLIGKGYAKGTWTNFLRFNGNAHLI